MFQNKKDGQNICMSFKNIFNFNFELKLFKLNQKYL